MSAVGGRTDMTHRPHILRLALAPLLHAAAAAAPAADPPGHDASSLRRWPMARQNAQHSGRSPFVGAQTSSVRWFLLPAGRSFATDPIVADDGTIYVSDDYVCAPACTGGNLYAINPDGTQKWR